MEFEWDEAKNRVNIRKHGIDFNSASCVFDDPLALNRRDRIEDGEQRWQILGVIEEGILLLLVVFVYRDAGDTERIRIISARKATKRERKSYEETI